MGVCVEKRDFIDSDGCSEEAIFEINPKGSVTLFEENVSGKYHIQ